MDRVASRKTLMMIKKTGRLQEEITTTRKAGIRSIQILVSRFNIKFSICYGIKSGKWQNIKMDMTCNLSTPRVVLRHSAEPQIEMTHQKCSVDSSLAQVGSRLFSLSVGLDYSDAGLHYKCIPI